MILSCRISPLVDKGPTFRRYLLSRSSTLGYVEMEVAFCSKTLAYGVLTETVTVLWLFYAEQLRGFASSVSGVKDSICGKRDPRFSFPTNRIE